MPKGKPLAIGAGLAVAVVALSLGGYWWKVESRRRKEAAERVQRRAKNLEAELQALRSFEDDTEMRKVLADPASEARKLLADPAHKQLVRESLPDLKKHYEGILACNQLLQQVFRGIAERRYVERAGVAAEGFVATTQLIAQLLEKALEKYKQLRQTNSISQAVLLSDAGDVYSGLAQLTQVYQGAFLGALHAVLVNSPTPTDRLMTFDLAAKAYPSATLEGGRRKLEPLLREAFTEEDDAGNKARMRETLERLKIPLTVEAKKAEKAGK